MIKELDIQIAPSDYEDGIGLNELLRVELGLNPSDSFEIQILKKSIDARQKMVQFRLKIRAYINEPKQTSLPHVGMQLTANVSSQPPVHIIGAGPAGLFAALQCIELGFRPVLIERGKNVRERRRDLAVLNKEGILNEESNYCFGEGGAGTYSDGKLYTRSKKRGDVEQVLSLFHYFGAHENILFEAHPHIGTNKLPQIIEAIRERILACGGEIHFEHKLTDLELNSNTIKRIQLNHSLWLPVQHVILATGHSAEDVYELLHRHGIALESKPFALGVRAEHPQYLIDQAQYHCSLRDDFLPPAAYSLVEQVEGRGVFSFCMCPGGIIAPASTTQGRLVVNGWSPSKRNNPYANSGMVVSIMPSDFDEKDPLAGLRFQHAIEERAFQAGGGKFVAPAQRLTDFIRNRSSATLPDCSYVPGLRSENLSSVLPSIVFKSLQRGFAAFSKKMKGFYTEEAVVVATESRTSSPVRIPRDKEKLFHIHLNNVYPCAEGAGYAGGIVSAAMDGIQIVKQIALQRRS